MHPIEIQITRYALAAVWLVTGIISLGIYPVEDSLKLLARVGFHGTFAVVTLYFEALLDIAIGLLTLTKPSQWLWRLQTTIIVGYTAVISVFLPEFWLHPFGPLLKNLPILTLLWLLYRHEGITS